MRRHSRQEGWPSCWPRSSVWHCAASATALRLGCGPHWRPEPRCARPGHNSEVLLQRAVDALAEMTVVPSFSRVGIALRRRLEVWREPPPMDGQVVVLTGGTSGIGLAAATAMARLGATVHLVGRDPERARRARSAVEAAGGARYTSILSTLPTAMRVASDEASLSATTASTPSCTMRDRFLALYKATPAGVELTVATQVLGPYVLTATLAPLLWKSSPATIVTVSSGGMYTQRFDLEHLEMGAVDYDGVVAYARCKRAEVILADAWHGRSVLPAWSATPCTPAG